jgi:hypothetical protein
MFAALSRAFPLHPASGIVSAAASANPIISFLLFILPLLFPSASLENGPSKTGTIPASLGSQPKGQWRLALEKDARAFFAAFDKADSDKDDLLSYLEIETWWRSSSRCRVHTVR